MPPPPPALLNFQSSKGLMGLSCRAAVPLLKILHYQHHRHNRLPDKNEDTRDLQGRSHRHSHRSYTLHSTARGPLRSGCFLVLPGRRSSKDFCHLVNPHSETLEPPEAVSRGRLHHTPHPPLRDQNSPVPRHDLWLFLSRHM